MYRFRSPLASFQGVARRFDSAPPSPLAAFGKASSANPDEAVAIPKDASRRQRSRSNSASPRQSSRSRLACPTRRVLTFDRSCTDFGRLSCLFKALRGGLIPHPLLQTRPWTGVSAHSERAAVPMGAAPPGSSPAAIARGAAISASVRMFGSYETFRERRGLKGGESAP